MAVAEYGSDVRQLKLNELRVIEYMDADGEIRVVDLSQDNAGGEINPAKQLELIEWARASVTAPMVLAMVQALAIDDEDDEEATDALDEAYDEGEELAEEMDED